MHNIQLKKPPTSTTETKSTVETTTKVNRPKLESAGLLTTTQSLAFPHSRSPSEPPDELPAEAKPPEPLLLS